MIPMGTCRNIQSDGSKIMRFHDHIHPVVIKRIAEVCCMIHTADLKRRIIELSQWLELRLMLMIEKVFFEKKKF